MSTISRVHSNEKATNRLTKKQKTIVSLPTPPTSSAGLEPLQRVRLCVLKKNNVNAKRNRTITHTHTHTPIHRHRQKKIVTDADVATPCRFPTRRSAASAGTRATATGSVWTSRATKTTPASSWGPSTRPPVPVNGWARPLLAQLGRFRCFFFSRFDETLEETGSFDSSWFVQVFVSKFLWCSTSSWGPLHSNYCPVQVQSSFRLVETDEVEAVFQNENSNWIKEGNILYRLCTRLVAL